MKRETQPGLSHFFLEKESIFLFLLAVLLFFPELFFSKTQYFRDLTFYILAQKAILVDLVSSGHLPLWNPLLQGGQAFLPSVSNMTLVPLNILFFIMPPLRALNLMLTICLAACFETTYLLTRCLGFRRVSAVLAAVAFGLSGLNLSLVNMINLFLALAHLPILLAFWHLWLRESRKIWLVLALCTAVSQFFSGAPELSVLSLAFLLAWTVFSTAASVRRKLVSWVFLVILTIGLVAIQLLPTLEIAHISPRGYGLDPFEVGHWSLHPKRLPELVVPSLLGNIDRIPARAYWGHQLVDDGPFLLSIYFGVPLLVLVVFGGLFPGVAASLSRKLRLFLLALCLLFPTLALGRFLPGFPSVLEVLPLASLFRFPSKFLLGMLLPAVLLAASGYEGLFFGLEEAKLDRKWVVLPTTMLTLAVVLGFLSAMAVSNGLLDPFLSHFFQTEVSPEMRQGVTASLVHSAGFSLAFILILILFRSRSQLSWKWFIPLLIFLDLSIAGSRIVPNCPDWMLENEPKTARFIRKKLGNGRLYRTPDRRVDLHTPGDDLAWGNRWSIEALTTTGATIFGIPAIYHEDIAKLSPVTMMKLGYYANTLPWNKRIPILRVASVHLVATEVELKVEGLQFLASISTTYGPPLRIYRLKDPAPIFNFVTHAQCMDSDEDALNLMWNTDFDPRVDVLLSCRQDLNFGENPENFPRIPPVGTQHLDTIKSTANRHIIRTEFSSDGFLVFSQPFAPGWKVRVDGKAGTLQRANVAFSAVHLKAGRHIVDYYYLPTSLVIGACISLMTALSLILGLVLIRRNSRRSRFEDCEKEKYHP